MKTITNSARTGYIGGYWEPLSASQTFKVVLLTIVCTSVRNNKQHKLVRSLEQTREPSSMKKLQLKKNYAPFFENNSSVVNRMLVFKRIFHDI